MKKTATVFPTEAEMGNTTIGISNSPRIDTSIGLGIYKQKYIYD